ncbi:MAG: Ig-like domain repeat protein, partial [Candidatus Solibacter usitatus]|nr:Ig-like domain repeat protein [Candidatus Solibacter usitatus]
ISATLAPAGVLANYTITYNTASFTINRMAASVTPNAASKLYGAVDPALTGTLSGFLPSDGVTATYTRTPGETVAGSPYTISAALSPAGVLGNYNITYSTANFTINQAAATIALTNLTHTYDATAKSPTVTTTPNGLSYTLTGAPQINAGSYAVSATITNPNYTSTPANGTLLIAKADQTIAFGALANKSYGDPAFAVNAVATSGLAVSFSASGVCTVAGNVVTVTALGNCTITASQAGNANYNAAAPVPQTFAVTKAATVTTITADTPDPSLTGQVVTVTYAVTGNGAPAGSVTVTASSGESCTATVTAGNCTIVFYTIGARTLTAAYAGNTNNNASSSTAAAHTVNIAPPAANGAFVIGDVNAVIGRTVTFWGSQWEKQNSLSGGASPANFKGFAEAVAAGASGCSGTWQSGGGNSTNPPATVPGYVTMLVTSSATKSGNAISGNIRKLVVVKTNPGYGPDPSMPGTGTVVSVTTCP